MDHICLKAYAKVNLTLDIVGRRDDGYHLLSSVMQSISLADTIILEKKPQGIIITSDHSLVPNDQTNICWRAFTAFRRHTKITGGVGVTLHKEIPVAAGLGGGSADAAAMLHGLNRLYSTRLDLGQLQKIGLTIGADVPFCLQGGTCLAQGIGERVTPLKTFPEVVLVLVKPEAAVSTHEIYGKLDSSAYGGTSTQRVLELLEQNQDAPSLAAACANALESVTSGLVPEVLFWKERLLAGGAHQAIMSGSGPTVFGLFTDEKLALEFRNRFRDEDQIFVVKPMNCGVAVMNGGDR